MVFCLESPSVRRALAQLLADKSDIRIVLFAPGKDQYDEGPVLYLMGQEVGGDLRKKALETVLQLTELLTPTGGIYAHQCRHDCVEVRLAEAIRSYERSTCGRTYWLVINEVLPGNHSRVHIRYGGVPITIQHEEALETIERILRSKDPLKDALNDLLAEVGDDRELDEPVATCLEELVGAGANQDQLVANVARRLTVENPATAAGCIVSELIKRGLLHPKESDNPFDTPLSDADGTIKNISGRPSVVPGAH